MGTWGWQGVTQHCPPLLQGLLLRQFHHLPAVRPAEPAEAILVPGLWHRGRALKEVWPDCGVSGPRLPPTHHRALGWTQSTQWWFGDWGGPGSGIFCSWKWPGGNHCWTPASPGSMESLTGGARIGLTGIWLRPHSGSCRPCLEPGCGQGRGAGQGWWSDRCCQDRVPPTHNTGLWSLPSPRHHRSRGRAPRRMLRDLEQVRCGAAAFSSPRCFL